MGGLISIFITACLISPLIIAGGISSMGRSVRGRVLSALAAALVCFTAPPVMLLITFTQPGGMFQWAAIIALFNMPFGVVFLGVAAWRWLVACIKALAARDAKQGYDQPNRG